MSGVRCLWYYNGVFVMADQARVWTPEIKQRLTELWMAGKSASEIAPRLRNDTWRPTRNAVIGQVRRMGLPSRKTVRNPRMQAADQVRGAKMRLAPRKAAARPYKPVLPMVMPGPDQEYKGQPKLITDLRLDHDCHYPVTGTGAVGDPHRFCGAPVARGNYCARHAKIMWTRV